MVQIIMWGKCKYSGINTQLKEFEHVQAMLQVMLQGCLFSDSNPQQIPYLHVQYIINDNNYYEKMWFVKFQMYNVSTQDVYSVERF